MNFVLFGRQSRKGSDSYQILNDSEGIYNINHLYYLTIAGKNLIVECRQSGQNSNPRHEKVKTSLNLQK